MSKDVYVLEKAVSSGILYGLNMSIDASLRLYKGYTTYLHRTHHGYPTMKEIEDWVSAIESGKKIVNPISPKEELKEMLEDEESEPEDRLWYDGWKKGIIEAVKVIAKEHPDVGKWLKEDDQDD